MGDGHRMFVAREVRAVIDALDGKSARIVREPFGKLEEPHPSSDQWDGKKLVREGQEPLYRLHVGRPWTAFSRIADEGGVHVFDLLSIDQAHERYGQVV